MNEPTPFPEDPRLFEIYELGARMTVCDTKDARLWLWGELRQKLEALLADRVKTGERTGN